MPRHRSLPVCLPAISTLFVVLSLLLPATGDAQPLTGYTAVPPTLDGTMGAVEWQSAASTTFTLSYCGESHLVTISVMNNAIDLFIGVLIRDEDWPGIPAADEFIVHFDNDGNGNRDVGDDTWRIGHDGTLTEDGHHPGGTSLNFIADTASAAGTNDLAAAIAHSSPAVGTIGDYTIEARRPLDNFDDLHDPSWQVGDLAGLAFSIVETALPVGCDNVYPDPDPAGWISIEIAGAPAGCAAPTGLAVTTPCDVAGIDATWIPSAIHDSYVVEIFENATGALVATDTLPAGSSSYSTLLPGVGLHEVRVTGVCPAGTTGVEISTVLVAPFPDGTTNVVVGLEGLGGLIASASALTNSLTSIGRQNIAVDDLLSFSCASEMGPGNVLWVALGTFPNNHVLTADEGLFLVDLVLAGVSIYIEGGDHWGFDPPTEFRNYDGIAGTAADGNVISNGDDSLSTLQGLSHDTLDLTAHFGPYEQDTLGNDSTDQLIPTGSPGFAADLNGTNAGAIWQSNAGYAVAIYYVPPPMFGGGGVVRPGKVIGSAFEFGGYCGDEDDALETTSLCLKDNPFGGPEFSRGDCNGDGLFNVADAIFTLGAVFGTGPPSDCADACDSNDDELLDIADPIWKLTYLFSMGAAPPDPFGACGSDPTAGALSCLAFSGCP